MSELTFYRHRVMYRHGYGEWEYREVQLESMDWESFQDEVGCELALHHGNYSPDGFRKVEIEKVENPPQEWLLARVLELDAGAKWRKERAGKLKRLLKPDSERGES